VNFTQAGISFSGIQSVNKITFVILNGFPIEVTQGNGTAIVTEDLTVVYEKQ
ncbi:MAG: hypothetical protein H0X63_13110, partial [Flavobacteriales bacterium]|nr:hypothetical protein [Flavobacteriales bacterium]